MGFMELIEAFLPKTTKIDGKEKIGEGRKKAGVTWSISYTLPKPMTLDAQMDSLKTLQKFDEAENIAFNLSLGKHQDLKVR